MWSPKCSCNLPRTWKMRFSTATPHKTVLQIMKSVFSPAARSHGSNAHANGASAPVGEKRIGLKRRHGSAASYGHCNAARSGKGAKKATTKGSNRIFTRMR